MLTFVAVWYKIIPYNSKEVIMSLNTNLRVPLPVKGIAYKRIKKDGPQYVYFTTASYRGENGNPTNKRTAIGKLDEKSGMLIPNNNYYNFFPDTTSINFSANTILDFGSMYLIDQILSKLSIKDFLKEAFGSHFARNIELIASYMCLDSSVMFYLEDFCTSNFIFDNLVLSSGNASTIFDKITHDGRMKFYKKWVKYIGEKEYIAYDVTSISSYSKGQDDVEFGYNRDKEKLPQINLGMYFGEETGLPIFYTKYAGSILDKSYLKYMMLYNEELNIKNVNFVMDKGFYSKDNIQYMKTKEYPFIMCVSNKLITSNSLLDKHEATISSYANYIKEMDVYGVKDSVSTYGTKTDVHIYYDEDKARIQKKDMYIKIEKYDFELSQLKTLTKKQYKLYNTYFDITINNDGSFKHTKSSCKIDKLSKRNGYFILISTIKSDDPKEILSLYRRKDKVEKSFDNLKNYIDFKRIRTHTDSNTEGKLFVGFIALIIKSYIEYKLKDYFSENNSTVEKVLRELQKIKVVKINNGQSLMAPLSSAQKKIYEKFDIFEHDIISYINAF